MGRLETPKANILMSPVWQSAWEGCSQGIAPLWGRRNDQGEKRSPQGGVRVMGENGSTQKRRRGEGIPERVNFRGCDRNRFLKN